MPSTEATSAAPETPAPRALPPAGQSTAPTLRMRLTGWRLTVADACRRDPARSLGLALAGGFAIGRLARFVVRRRSPSRPRDHARRRKA